MRKQKPRTEMTKPLTCPGGDQAAFPLGGVTVAEKCTGFEIRQSTWSMAGSVTD